MIKIQLETLIGSKAKLAILRHLCNNSENDFTVIEISDKTGFDKSSVSRIISGLEKKGIVSVTYRGNLKLCRINANAGAFRFLKDLFNSESKIK